MWQQIRSNIQVREVTSAPREAGVLLGILRGGVPPGSPNPDSIYKDQKITKMSFFTPVFRPDL